MIDWHVFMTVMILRRSLCVWTSNQLPKTQRLQPPVTKHCKTELLSSGIRQRRTHQFRGQLWVPESWSLAIWALTRKASVHMPLTKPKAHTSKWAHTRITLKPNPIQKTNARLLPNNPFQPTAVMNISDYPNMTKTIQNHQLPPTEPSGYRPSERHFISPICTVHTRRVWISILRVKRWSKHLYMYRPFVK